MYCLYPALETDIFYRIIQQGVKVFKKAGKSEIFTISPKKWIEAIDAIGIVSKTGCYGNTFNKSIIFEYKRSWYYAAL